MTYRGRTDRRYNDWHYTLPADWDYIDLDGVDVCHRCRQSLLLTETTRDPNKATSIIAGLAHRADLPAVLLLLPEADVAHRCEDCGTERLRPLTDATVVRWRWIRPARGWTEATLGDWRAEIADVRKQHDAERHQVAA